MTLQNVDGDQRQLTFIVRRGAPFCYITHFVLHGTKESHSGTISLNEG